MREERLGVGLHESIGCLVADLSWIFDLSVSKSSLSRFQFMFLLDTFSRYRAFEQNIKIPLSRLIL